MTTTLAPHETPAAPNARPHRKRLAVAAGVVATASVLGVIPALAAPAPIVESTSTSQTYQSPTFKLAIKDHVTGNANVTLRKDGSFTFNTHAHNSGLVRRNYSLSCAVVSRSHEAYLFTVSGKLGGTFGGGSRTADRTETGVNARIAADWPNLVGGASATCTMDQSWNSKAFFGAIPDAVSVVTTVVGIF